jgi:hypothetical protein
MNRLWINREKRRYYRAIFQRDLLGDLILVRSWGSLDSNHGRVQHEIVDSQDTGALKLAEIDKVRVHRGYQSTHRTDVFIKPGG